MKHAPTVYAKSLVSVLRDTPSLRHGRIIKNFVGVLWKYGDWRARENIVAAFGRALVRDRGGRMVRIETARVLPRSLRESIKASLVQEHDIVQECIDPSLIAGARIVINEEREFDGSLKRKLAKLF